MSPIIYCNNLRSFNNTMFRCEHISFINKTRRIQWAGVTKMANGSYDCAIEIVFLFYTWHMQNMGIAMLWLSFWLLWLSNLWIPLPTPATYLKHLCPGTGHYIYLECYSQLMYFWSCMKHPWNAQIGIFQK